MTLLGLFFCVTVFKIVFYIGYFIIGFHVSTTFGVSFLLKIEDKFYLERTIFCACTAEVL